MNLAKKKILVRADGGEGIGLGKLVIALAVARKLQEKGANILFVTVQHHLWTRAVFEGVPTKILPQSFFQEGLELTDIEIRKFRPDMVILNVTDPDIYEAQKPLSKFPEWIDDLRKRGIQVVGIEGGATKGYRADVIFNGTIVDEWHRYENFPNTEYFIGPQFMILRESFSREAEHKRVFSKECKNVFVGVGGGTEGVERTLFPRILNVLTVLGFRGNVYFTVGAAYSEVQNLKLLLKRWKNAHILEGLTEQEMAKTMAKADLAISAGGITLYELACLGVPSLVVSIVPHQMFTAKTFEEKGAAKSLGMDPSVSEFESALSSLMKDVSARKTMAQKAQRIVDGKGLERVLLKVESMLQEK